MKPEFKKYCTDLQGPSCDFYMVSSLVCEMGRLIYPSPRPAHGHRLWHDRRSITGITHKKAQENLGLGTLVQIEKMDI